MFFDSEQCKKLFGTPEGRSIMRQSPEWQRPTFRKTLYRYTHHAKGSQFHCFGNRRADALLLISVKARDRMLSARGLQEPPRRL